MARNSKSGWLLYCMIGVPWCWWVKIGITHIGIGALKRAFSIDKAMIGFPFPIMVVPIPGAYYFEQRIHRILKPINFRFYKGDGGSEWFWFFAAFFVIPVMLAIWGPYLKGLDLILETSIYPVVKDWFIDALLLVGEYLIGKF